MSSSATARTGAAVVSQPGTQPDGQPVGRPSAQTGVQSLHRALDILELVAARGGSASIAEIAAAAELPAPTTHRLLRTLVERGYMRQLPNRTYALGFRLVPLGATANVLSGVNAEQILHDLVDELGETANLAVLSGHQAEYVAQVPARYTMRMFTEVGRRVHLHCTGVGKALLARLDDDAVRAIIARSGLPQQTEHTITTEAGLLADLDEIRARQYALDDQEQELGVRCIAAAVASSSLSWMAVSVSGPVTRMTDQVVQRSVPLIQAAAQRLAADITGSAPAHT
ncbi:MAG: transcriptional regulator, IclR family [Frankiales bacterium]|nr:transcriptional regulator, IclR family [Frankiales bacterium]